MVITDDNGNMFGVESILKYENDPVELKLLINAFKEAHQKIEQENAELRASVEELQDQGLRLVGLSSKRERIRVFEECMTIKESSMIKAAGEHK